MRNLFMKTPHPFALKSSKKIPNKRFKSDADLHQCRFGGNDCFVTIVDRSFGASFIAFLNSFPSSAWECSTEAPAPTLLYKKLELLNWIPKEDLRNQINAES